jgi:hypothetical protein
VSVAKRSIQPVFPDGENARTELALIEEWAALDRPTRLKRWDVLQGKQRRVLVDAFGPALFREGA